MSLSVTVASEDGGGGSLVDRPAFLAALASFGVASFLIGQNPFGDVVRHLALPDTDDAMRLVGVRDLLAGQPWFDTVQHRYLPPAGAWMPWSRLLDLPLALLIAGLTPLIGRALAECWVVALWPPALFLVYLAVIFAGTRRLFGLRAAAFAVFVAGELANCQLFSYGRIDHHNVQAIALSASALLLASPAAGLRESVAAGAIAALSLAIGLETLPFVAALGAGLVLLWVVDRATGRPMAAFGASLAASSFAFFVVETSPSAWFTKSCDSLSPPWLLLAAGGGLAACVLAALGRRAPSPGLRLAIASGLGAALVAVFALTYPDCLAGPWAALPEAARAGWLDQVSEMQSLWQVATRSALSGAAIGIPLATACLAVLAGLAVAGPERRRTFAILAAFLATGLAITLIHVRGFFVGAAIIPVVGGWLFDRALARLLNGGWAMSGRGARAVTVTMLTAAFLTLTRVAILPVVATEALAARADQKVTSILEQTGCRSADALGRLDTLAAGTVLAPTDLGPSLLLYTHHAIIAAPYHRNGDGIVAGIAAETGTDTEVEGAVRRFSPDYLLVCRTWTRVIDRRGSLALKLTDGGSEPWLEPVLSSGDLLLYRVQPDRMP